MVKVIPTARSVQSGRLHAPVSPRTAQEESDLQMALSVAEGGHHQSAEQSARSWQVSASSYNRRLGSGPQAQRRPPRHRRWKTAATSASAEPWMIDDPPARPSTSTDEQLARALQQQEEQFLQQQKEQFLREQTMMTPYYHRGMEQVFQLRSGRQVHSGMPQHWGQGLYDNSYGIDHSGWRTPQHAPAHATVGDSYEELLALDDTIPKRGVTDTQLFQRTVTHSLAAGAASRAGSCTICLDDFAEGEEVRRLPCLCVYHTGCIDRHLAASTTCPICRLSVLDVPSIPMGSIPATPVRL